MKRNSLQEVYRTIPVPKHWPWWRKMFAFLGPGYLVAVGYMDPGNWATDLSAGSQFGYKLLTVILVSNLIAILLQSLAAKLGVATGRDLAQACKEHYSPFTSFVLWILAEIAIIATDLAEIIGSAIALNLLFGLPLIFGVLITALDILLILYLQKWNFRLIEIFVISLIGFIFLCFAYEIVLSKPVLSDVLRGYLPKMEIFTNREMLYVSIALLGARVVPHNLYLHSSIVQTRKYTQDSGGKKEAIKFVTLDSTIALSFAFFINSAILIMAAAVFYQNNIKNVAEIQDAYLLLAPALNVPLASVVFALALLASGQNSTLTGTLAGQVVMEGFLNIRLRPWVRRALTRGVALIPAIICVYFYGESSTAKLLVFTQVVLSLQLSFAVIPLVLFTGNKLRMGQFVNPLWIKLLAMGATALIVVLNGKYLVDFVMGR